MDLSELNAAQRAAVTASDGAHLVIAGAGTGKTKTLVHRVAWLLDRGVPPAHIVLLTFTRRAAREMLERCAGLVGPQAHRVRGGTFHSFANLALRRHAGKLGYSPSFTILDRGDAESMVGLLRAELGLGGKDRRFARKGTIMSVISRSVNTGKSIEDVLDEQYPQYRSDTSDFEAIAARYAERKKQQDVMDFDDLLVRLAELLSQHDEARRQLSHQALHVLVDEYQDTNRLQARIAALLSSVHGNLMVVGDEAQSIYAFRGAVVDNILDFPELHAPCGVITLEQNYRSIQPILDLANGVLATASRRYDKRLRSALLAGPKPVLWDVADEHVQADLIVREVLARREEGIDLAQQAVLFRSGHHANLLEVALTDAGIPYKKYGGLRFSEAAHIKDVFALLRLVANPRDQLAWFRVLGWCEGVGTKTAQRIGADVVSAAEPRLMPERYAKKRYHGDLVDLAGMLARADEVRDDLGGVVQVIVEGYRKLIPRIHEDHKRRVRDLDSIDLLAERHDTLDALLSDVALDPVEESELEPQQDEDDELLTLSTIHSAKGLEWDHVVVMQLGDGGFPSAFSLDDDEELEEERRLLYVAVTRARRHLSLIVPRFLRQFRGPILGPGCVLLESIDDLALKVDVQRPGAMGWGAQVTPAGQAEQARLHRFRDWFDD